MAGALLGVWRMLPRDNFKSLVLKWSKTERARKIKSRSRNFSKVADGNISTSSSGSVLGSTSVSHFCGLDSFAMCISTVL